MKPTWQRAIIVAFIVVGIVIVGFFGMRTFHAFRDFHGHRPPPGKVETDVEKIRDWMTIPFISRTYMIPDKFLFDAAGIPEQGNRNKSLKSLNTIYFPQSNGIVLEKIKSAILEHRPPPPPDGANTSMPPATVVPTQP